MRVFEYRQYQRGDERCIVELWNECLYYDLINSNRFRNMILLDPNFDPEGLRLAFSEEKLVGCLYGVRRQLPMHGTELEPNNGWITFFFVSPAYRRQGVGTRLLSDVAAFFERHGRTNVFFSSYAPNYIVPGIDRHSYPEGYQWLVKHGFEELYAPVAMDYSLVGLVYPTEVFALKSRRIAEDYTFELAVDGDLYELICFATDVFNPDWGRAIRDGILQGLPLSSIHVVRKQGRLIGFCVHGGYEGVNERFGPFGIAPDQQGKGIGTILLYECLLSMRAQGLHGAWFMWTGEQTPAGYLYKKIGFQVTRNFSVMRRCEGI
jgi:mycothiol synthase